MVQEIQMMDNGNGLENPIKYDVPIWKIWKHKRYVLSILAFFGFMNMYALRTNLNIAIVDMTDFKNITLEDGSTILKREFEWDSTIRGYVLSSFFYGYILTQILGGYFAVQIGGAKVYGFGIAATSIFTLITPWIAKTNVYLLIAVRTIEGAFEGVTYSALQEVWTHWAPPSERSRLVSIALSGSYFGGVFAMPICSLIATAYGWETIFYVFGTLGLIWYLIWIIVIRDTPSKDSRIDQKELVYIIEAIKAVKNNTKIKVPWTKIITSRAVIANTICLTCESWGFNTMLTFLPQIMKSLLGFELTKAGVLSAMPYLVTSISVQMSGQLADFLIRRKCMSTTNVTKCLIVTGLMGQAIFILVAGYWISSVGTPLCLIIGVGLGGIAISAMVTNSLYIAPKFAGVIFGMNNTIATIPGILSPILTGYIVTDLTSITQWRIVFFISSGLYFIGVIVSFFFTTGIRQPWAESENHDNIKDLNGNINGVNKNFRLEDGNNCL